METRDATSRSDWGSILVAVVVGLGVTLLAVAFGVAVGALATDAADNQVITAAVGGWVIVSALLGAFVGTLVGGRLWRGIGTAPAVFHGMSAWALTTVVTVWLGVTGVVGLLGTALRGVETAAQEVAPGEPAAPLQLPGIPADAVGWGGWALFLGLLLALGASILGWIVGARTRPAPPEPAGRVATEAEAPVRRERLETRR